MGYVDGSTTAKLADLVPYANNAKQHSPEQVEKIAASIRGFCIATASETLVGMSSTKP